MAGIKTVKYYILKAGLDLGLWTLDSGLWTLDSGLWTLDSGLWTLDFSSQNFTSLPKKTSISPPIKLPSPQKNAFPQIKNSTTSDFFLINKLEVCEISNKQRYSPHPPPRKNLYVSPLKLPLPKSPPPLPK